MHLKEIKTTQYRKDINKQTCTLGILYYNIPTYRKIGLVHEKSADSNNTTPPPSTPSL